MEERGVECSNELECCFNNCITNKITLNLSALGRGTERGRGKDKNDDVDGSAIF